MSETSPSSAPLRLRLLVVALFSVSFLGALDHTVVSTSLPTIAGELDAVSVMSLVFVSYTLAATVSLPLVGRLAERVGARGVFLGSLILFVVASLACGFAADIVQLVIARAAQGLGSAGLSLLSQTIIGGALPPRQRPKYLGLIGAAFPVAILIGPFAGGVVTDLLGWRWIFWLNAPIGVAALVLALASVPRLERLPQRAFDLAGTLLLILGTSALVLACTWAGELGVLAPATIAAAALAVVLAVAFALVERRAVEPVVPVLELRSRTVLIATALSLVTGAGLFSVVSYIPTYVQMVFGTSATEAGLVPIATVLGQLVATVATGWVVSRSGRYRAFPVIGCLLGAAGLAAMATLPAGLPLWVPMLVMSAVGLGTGAFMNLVVAIAQSDVPAASIGRVTTAVNMIRQIGATVGTAAIGTVVSAGVLPALPAGLGDSATPDAVRAAGPSVAGAVADAYAGAFVPVFVALAIVHVGGVVAALLLPPHRLPDRQPEAPEAAGPAGAADPVQGVGASAS